MARPAYERVGAAFRELYEAAGLRQTDVAEALGVDPATVSKWSRGLQRIDLEYFPSIDRLCGRRLGDVLRKAGYVEDPPPADARAAIEADPNLDAVGRDAVLGVYDAFLSRSKVSASAEHIPAR